MNMKKIAYIFSIIVITLFYGCKDDTNDFEILGEAIGSFENSTPANNSIVYLNSGAPTTAIRFEWTESKPGVNKPVSYTFELVTEDGDIIYSSNSASDGTALYIDITHNQLDNILSDYGIAAAQVQTILWRVFATNGDMEKYSSSFHITLKRFAEGIEDFNLEMPSDNSVVSLDTVFIPDVENIRFSWSAIQTLNASELPSLRILFDKSGGNFNNPIYEQTADASSTFIDIPISDFYSNLVDEGENLNGIRWTVEASYGELRVLAPFNVVSLDTTSINEQLYLYGSGTFSGSQAINALAMYEISSANSFMANTYLSSGELFFAYAQNAGATLSMNGEGLLDFTGTTFPIDNESQMNLIVANTETREVTIVPTVLGIFGAATPNGTTQTNLTQVGPYLWQSDIYLLGDSWFYIRLNDNNSYIYSKDPDTGEIRFGRTTQDQFRTDGLTDGTYTVTIDLTHGNYSYSLQLVD